MAKMEVFLFLTCTLSQAMGCFRLITPSRWGANLANCSAPLKTLLPEYAIILHTAGPSCTTRPECSSEMRRLQQFHQGKGWCDVGYNFVIGEDGFVYEGRGWRSEGAHAYGYNDLSLGISIMGNFTERSPNEAAWRTLKCLLTFSVKIGYLSPDYHIMAHSDVSNTDSPGEAIRSVITKWPNYKHN